MLLGSMLWLTVMESVASTEVIALNCAFIASTSEKPEQKPQMAIKSMAHTIEMESHAVFTLLLNWRRVKAFKPRK